MLEHTTTVLNRVRQQSDSVLLFYSGGKDSIVLLDLLSKKFEKVYAVQMYFVPGLRHIQKYIEWSRMKYENVEFKEIPHWNLTFILASGTYCSPVPDMPLKTFKDVIKKQKEETGSQFAFMGMKQADSMNRRLMLKSLELQAISKTGNVYPLSLWKDADIHSYIRFHKLIKPITYGENKRSHGAIFNEAVFLYLEKIFRHFPLSQSILFNHYQHAEA